MNAKTSMPATQTPARVILVTRLGTEFVGTITRQTASRIEWVDSEGKAYGAPAFRIINVISLDASEAN